MEKSMLSHTVLFVAEDAHSAFALLLCCFFISLKNYNRLTKNYPVEVCLLSHKVTLKALFSTLHGRVRFLRNSLPTFHLASLAIGLPA